MKTIRLMACLITALLCTASAPASGQQQKQPILVGHIDHVEGQLLRYVPETKDWVATVKDAPFGLEDALFADKNTRAEIIMPNNTMLRIGGSTQAQLLRLAEDVAEIDIASGTARFYNNSSKTIIRTTTPFGQIVAPAGAVFDLYVGDDSIEVIAVKGTVDYVHPSGSTKYDVRAGASSIVANRSQVTSGEGLTDASWNSWNAERDRIWARRLEPKGETVRYVPPELYTESYVLEEQGRWDNVYYDGGYRQFWRPTYVSAGWSPYTCGRWTTWYGDQVWIPAEPFGYVTHHYGSWVYVDASRCWYWAPPVVAVNIAAVPSYTVSYGWYPGRVSWIYSETDVGWVPLAPYEPYYCHHYWGPTVIIVGDFDDDHHHGDHHDDHHGKHHYEDHAVVVNQHNLYTVNNYNDVRIKNVDKATIAKSYRGSPVVNSMVIKNHKDLLQKYNFADLNVRQKPHQTVLDRIQQNMATAKRGERQPASTILQKLDRMKEGKPADGNLFKGRPQQVTDKMVPERDVNRPKALTLFPTRELKPSGQVRPEQHETQEPLRDKRASDADRGRPDRTGLNAVQKSDQGGEKIRLPEAEKNRPESDRDRLRPPREDENKGPGVHEQKPVRGPDENKPGIRPDRNDDKPVAEQPERFHRPEQTDTTPPKRPVPPVLERPETLKPTPRRTDDAWRPRSNTQQPSQETDREQPRMPPDRDQDNPAVSRPERYQRPEPPRPQIDRDDQPALPRHIEKPRYTPPEPRHIEQPVRQEPQVQQPRHIEQPVRQEPHAHQQPREAPPQPQHQPAYSQPETHTPVQRSPSGGHHQTAPQPSQPQSQQGPGMPRGFQR
jgi:hypothetical protein